MAELGVTCNKGPHGCLPVDMDATCVICGERGIEVTHVSVPWILLCHASVRDEEVASVVEAKVEVEAHEEDKQQDGNRSSDEKTKTNAN